MELTFIFALLMLAIVYSLLVDGLPIPNDWQSLIAPEIFSETVGKSQHDRFSPDVFEGDLMGFETDEPPALLRKKISTIFAPGSNSRWTGGIVPYTFNGTTSKLKDSDRRRITSALQQVEESLGGSCIHFVPRTNKQDFVAFIKGFACFSNVGRQGGKQLISLTEDCLQQPGSIQHLVLHALGLFHEIARTDRDSFITINRENILPEAGNNFNAYIDYGLFAGPYDVLPKTAGSRLGQLNGLSHLDIAKIRTAYGCNNVGAGTGDATESSLLEVTPDPPDQPVTSAGTSKVERKQLLKHPVFEMRDMTPEQCSGVSTPNCQIMPESKNCRRGFGLIARCQAQADNQEVRQFLSNIGRLNASRAMELTIKGPRTFSNDDFAPAASVIIILIIADYDGFEMSMLRSLDLPAITHIGMSNCRDVVIGQDDFLFFPRLTMLVLHSCTVAKIEQGAYESLPLLQQVEFDGGIPLDRKMSLEQRDYLRLLHCDCQYKWLRNFLGKNPTLITTKQAGEVHAFGGITSHSATIRQMYAPVDCARKNLIGEQSQVPFTVNDPCP